MYDVVMVAWCARRFGRLRLFLPTSAAAGQYAREQMEEAEKLFTNLQGYRSERSSAAVQPEGRLIVTNLPQDPRHGIGVPRRQRGP